MSQDDVVQYFRTLKDGALIFNQSSLSRNKKRHQDLKQRAAATPNGLDVKRPRIVTRPDVERALQLWYRSMEEKNEVVTGAMLAEKRKRVEDLLGVPPEECLHGDGWVQSFCKT